MFWWRRRKGREQDLERELRSHLELEAEEQGDFDAARRALGNQTRIMEDVRDSWGWTGVEQLFEDLRYALRTMRASPAFTAVALLSLALGIGANTAIFELVNAVRLRNLPVPDPQELARIQIRGGNKGMGLSGDASQLTYPLFLQIRDHQQAFSGVLAWSNGQSFLVGEGAQAYRVPGMLVSGNFFRTLRLSPAAGRLLTPEDDRPGCAAPGVVLSYGSWQTEFGGQSSAIGRRLTVEGHPFEIIGVAPANFSGLEVGRNFEFALPICAQSNVLPAWEASPLRTDVYWLSVLGRLKSGWSLAQADQHLQAIAAPLLEATLPVGYAAESVERYRRLSLEALPAGNGISMLRSQYDTALWLLLGITGLVLLIACSNLANLMLARAAARQREFAVRVALGAPRMRLVRQALCESLLLATAGATLGLALSRLLSGAVARFLSREDNPLHLDLSMDARVLWFTATVTITACLLFGLLPALRASRAEPMAAMKGGGRGLTGDRERFSFQRALVVSQIAVSLVLLVGALLFVGSFRNLVMLDPGFRERGILLASFDMSHLGLSPGAGKRLEREVLGEIRSLPQVEAAATTTTVLIGGGMWSLGLDVGGTGGWARFTWVSPGHFALLETPVLAGHDFQAGDTEASPKVAIVNQTFVRRYFGKANPIGRTFRSRSEPNYPETEYQIVGVTRDTKYFDLRMPTDAMVYAPASQNPAAVLGSQMYIRSQAPRSVVIGNIRRWVAVTHPGMTAEFRVFQTQIEEGLIPERLMAALSGFFGVLAALLATIGLYGVICYIMERRRNEIGIRLALGAGPPKVVGLVMKEAATLLIIGLAIGTVCSLELTRATTSLLFGLSAHDPLLLLAAAGLLAAAVGVGSYLPARRASRLDPMTALRCE
jgi:putative ABC transport system permease protein